MRKPEGEAVQPRKSDYRGSITRLQPLLGLAEGLKGLLRR
jgi:hypothetical protein